MQDLKQHFLLRDDIVYLNYGSFGACVKPVFEQYQQFQLELEREPVQFITVTGLRYLAAAREALADYVHCDMDDLVYVTNPSYAVNAIAKSFPLQAGDEVLSSDLEYGACDRTWDYYCQRAGAIFKRQPVSLPVHSKEQLVSEFCQGITSRTKLIFLSHITSRTGFRLPVEEIATIAKEKGILVFIDGAHVPGQLPLNLRDSPFDIYTGACHKWMMTPKGSSFLYVRKPLQDMVDPLVISWGYKAVFPSSSRFLDYHQLNGTRDFTAFLTIPLAIKFMREQQWERVATECRQLVQRNAPLLTGLLGTLPLTPVNDDFVLQLYSAEINTSNAAKLQQLLFDEYKIEVPVMQHGQQTYLRYSINAFNSQSDLDHLFAALTEIRGEGELIR